MNDDWQDHASANLIREDLRPIDSREAAITLTLEPGAYTAVVRGANQTTGVGIIEVFEVD